MRLRTLALALALAAGFTALGEANSKPPVHKVKPHKVKPRKIKRPKMKHR